MNDLLSITEQYLTNLQDDRVRLESVETGDLPLFLRKRYTLRKTALFGKVWLLAIEGPDWDAGTPKEYRQHLRLVGEAAGGTVVLVLGATTSTLRNRLVRMNIPFIVPGTQLFLPLASVNLTERYPSKGSNAEKLLTPTAQLLGLYQILRGELHNLSSKDIAATLGCSGMMITKARGELEARGICDVQRVGKEARVLFSRDTRSLWKRALDSMASPVAKKRWVQWDRPASEALKAGMTALSERTLMADNDVPTFALRRQVFTKLLEQGAMRGCPDRNGANALVECWTYDPCRLSDGPLVDPLSLYLSLRRDHDARVQGELESMLMELSWR
jgi:hypothetical protein